MLTSVVEIDKDTDGVLETGCATTRAATSAKEAARGRARDAAGRNSQKSSFLLILLYDLTIALTFENVCQLKSVNNMLLSDISLLEKESGAVKDELGKTRTANARLSTIAQDLERENSTFRKNFATPSGKSPRYFDAPLSAHKDTPRYITSGWSSWFLWWLWCTQTHILTSKRTKTGMHKQESTHRGGWCT